MEGDRVTMSTQTMPSGLSIRAKNAMNKVAHQVDVSLVKTDHEMAARQ